MKCRLLQRRRTHLRASTPGAAIAAQLRAQITCSTDPNRLERLACEAEGRSHTRNVRNGQSFLLRGLRRLSPRVDARQRAQRGDLSSTAD
jgi:hypothetical protein